MDKARVIGIWVSGIIAAGLIGGAIGAALSGFSGMPTPQIASPLVFGSVALFICLRLWRVEIRNIASGTVPKSPLHVAPNETHQVNRGTINGWEETKPGKEKGGWKSL